MNFISQTGEIVLNREDIKWFYKVGMSIHAVDYENNIYEMGHYWNSLKLDEQFSRVNKILHGYKGRKKDYHFGP